MEAVEDPIPRVASEEECLATFATWGFQSFRECEDEADADAASAGLADGTSRAS